MTTYIKIKEDYLMDFTMSYIQLVQLYDFNTIPINYYYSQTSTDIEKMFYISSIPNNRY